MDVGLGKPFKSEGYSDKADSVVNLYHITPQRPGLTKPTSQMKKANYKQKRTNTLKPSTEQQQHKPIHIAIQHQSPPT